MLWGGLCCFKFVGIVVLICGLRIDSVVLIMYVLCILRWCVACLIADLLVCCGCWFILVCECLFV